MKSEWMRDVDDDDGTRINDNHSAFRYNVALVLMLLYGCAVKGFLGRFFFFIPTNIQQEKKCII